MPEGTWTISEYHVYDVVEGLGLLEGHRDKEAVMDLQKRLMQKHAIKLGSAIVLWAENGIEATTVSKIVLGLLRFYPEGHNEPIRTYSICLVIRENDDIVDALKEVAANNWGMCELIGVGEM
ncbi:MAG: hypothetical protein WEB33_05030 [Bacteroidota bacterium]